MDGVLDLSDWDFEKDGIVELKGEWRFAWDEFVEPMPSEEFRAKYQSTIEVPASWHTQPHPDKQGEYLPGQGYATYALEVLLPPGPSGRELALASEHQSSAARYIMTETESASILGKASQGRPGINAESTVPVQVSIETPFDRPSAQSFQVHLQLSNFRHARGGTWYSPKLGLKGPIGQVASFKFALDVFVFGILFIIALYHLILFLQRREDRPSLFFALFCGTFAFRQWTTGLFSQELGMGHSVQGLELLATLEYITMPLILMSGGLFVHALVPGPYFKRFVYGFFVGLGALLVVFTLLVSTTTFTANLDIYQVHLLLSIAITLVYLIYKAFLGHVLARWVCLAFSVVVVGVVNDILMAHRLIQTGYVSAYTFIVFVLMQSGILSGKAAHAFRRAEHLGENLQKEVEEQTQDLNLKTLEAQEATLAALAAKEDAEKFRRDAEKHAIELKEIDQQKTAFFQNMSHELRTPLTLILNPLESATQRLPGDQEIAVATKNSRRLLRLVNQLLDFQKLEAGKQELKIAPLDLNRFTYVCGDYFYSACSSKGIEFLVNREGKSLVKDGEPIWVMGEVDALEKVAFNYLSNALKYTPKEGKIELGLHQANERIRLFVKDSGPGISEEGQAKLFEVFSQVDESTTRAYEGTGLGLALVKSLVEEMGGVVGVESEPGAGSTFWADFPLCEAPLESEDLDFEVKSWLVEQSQGETGTDDTGILEALEESSEGGAELVLVVDDIADMRDLIAGSLKKRNYRVATAPNGKRGVEIAKEIKPSLIITDWMMPQMSGPELIKELKSDDELNSVPIILLTAKSDEESKLIGTEIGADSYLGKPFNDQELGSIVKNLLSLKSKEREVEKLNHMLTETVLKRYISPVLVDKIIAGEISMDKPAEMRTITVLFSDLSGFTKASTQLGPQVISSFLNEYLTKMNDIIFEYGGTIDKFIGDGIMVMFGAPQDMPAEEQAKRAADCALAMQRAMQRIAKDWESEGAGHLRMRIGLHQGEAIVGNFGSDKRSDYTCIGPTVNLAARIESAGEAGHVYLSSELKELLPQESTAEAGEFELKGIEGKTNLYRLV